MNRPLDALAKSLIAFAILHQILLITHVVRNRDPGALNVFTMLEAHRLFPGLAREPGAQWLSFAFALLVYALVYALLSRPPARGGRSDRPITERMIGPRIGVFRPRLRTGILALAAGAILHCSSLAVIERLGVPFPSLTDVFIERLPYVEFGLPGELFFVAFLVTFASLLFRTQPASVPAVLTKLGLFYAVRGVFLFLLPIGAPVGAPALDSRFVFYPWADHAYFPGGHVGLMTIMCLSLEDVRWRRVLLAATGVFAIGTILARTHYTADGLGGWLVAYAVTAWGRRHLAAVQAVPSVASFEVGLAESGRRARSGAAATPASSPARVSAGGMGRTS